MSQKLQICACTLCVEGPKIINAQGNLQHGKLIPRSTRILHRKRDQDLYEDCRRELISNAATTRIAQDSPQVNQSNPGPAASQAPLQDGENVLIQQGVELRSIGAMKGSLFTVVCILAAWLHLVCGLSRNTTSQMLKVLDCIVKMAIEIGRLLQDSSNLTTSDALSPPIWLPHDVRTAIQTLSIEPIINRSICCPKCFSIYNLESLPAVCGKRETSRSRPCNEPLWVTRITRAGPRIVPRRLYSTQNFDSWLEFFLSRPGIEGIIDQSYKHTPSPDNMTSIWDSPAWTSLGSFSRTIGNLTFGYYIDWFNPFTNKIAGKTASCGAILMFCLNLPHDIQHLSENTFFAGITPPPKEPSVTTITAVSDPIINSLRPFWEGKLVKTYRHPQGVKMRVALLARIGDLLAIRKALGFAGVRSHNFCSFCKLRRANLEDLNYTNYIPRLGSEVLSAAKEWKESDSKARRKEIYDVHGVRWSSLHALPYGDPVRHTLLGVMHNWIEGILQHHARVLWGIGVEPTHGDGNDHGNFIDDMDSMTPQHPPHILAEFDDLLLDPDDIDEEIEGLHQESIAHRDTPSHITRLRSEASMALTVNETESDIEDVDFEPDAHSDGDFSDDDNYDNELWKASCIFSTAELNKIRRCLSDAVIPSWVERPPTNLGDKTHGKLKADHWFNLYSIFLPLIIPELWGRLLDARHKGLLMNFYDLVTCTNVVCAYSVSPNSSTIYQEHYIRYRKSSRSLFPKVGSRPNHHYAMHNSDMMKFWGPLMRLSEFAGERHNGSLQKIKTNNHLWEMDFTMLRQMCRRGRLVSLIKSKLNDANEFVASAMGILLPKQVQKEDPSGVGLKPIPDLIYQAILLYLHQILPSEKFRHAQAFPHPDGSRILSRYAIPVTRFLHKGRIYSTHALHPGNSSIYFQSQSRGIEDFGFIEAMWRFNDASLQRTFVVISVHEPLSPQDNKLSPYLSRPGLLARIVYARIGDNAAQLMIVEPDDIIGHVAFYNRPPKTFGIKRSTTVLVNSLHRSRQ